MWRAILDLDFDTTMRFWNSPKPTIAAVHGACLAGAFELAMACDITIADADASFGEPELKFGAGIVTLLLPWMTSPKQAKRIILSADDRIPAAEALAMGLVSRVVAPGTHLAEALRTARGIALMDPNLVAQTKKALNRTYDIQGMPTALRMALDIDHTIESHGSPDKRAFMDVARSAACARRLPGAMRALPRRRTGAPEPVRTHRPGAAALSGTSPGAGRAAGSSAPCPWHCAAGRRPRTGAWAP